MGGMEWDTREKRDGGAKEIMLHPNPYMTLSRHAITVFCATFSCATYGTEPLRNTYGTLSSALPYGSAASARR